MAENPTSKDIPVSWPELLKDRARAVGYELEDLQRLPDRLAAKPPRAISMAIGSSADTLSEAAIVLGPENCRPIIDLFDELCSVAISDLGQAVTAGSEVRALGLLNYLNAVSCCGNTDSPRASSVNESDWLSQIARGAENLTENELRNLAVAALATGRIDLVPAFIGGKLELDRFEPDKKFGFNTQGFVRYLAAAIDGDAEPEGVEIAWSEFLSNVPRMLASGTFTWVDLLWLGRALMVQIEKRPVETTAEGLHDLLQ